MPQETEQRKQKNLMLLAVLLALAVILFFTTIIKFGYLPPAAS